MSLAEFTYCADANATGDSERLTRTAQFGDGYAQQAGDGINNKRDSWPLTFTKRKAEAEKIKQFFDDHEGYKAFAWTPPLSPMKLFIAKDESLTPLGGGMYRITVTFEEVFHP